MLFVIIEFTAFLCIVVSKQCKGSLTFIFRSLNILFNSFPSSVPIWHRLAKHSILILEGIMKKNSYERCDYESVDEKSLS